MKTLAALHNPDLGSGGKNVICDLGDSNINSRIGAQWMIRAGELLEKGASKPHPDALEKAGVEYKIGPQIP